MDESSSAAEIYAEINEKKDEKRDLIERRRERRQTLEEMYRARTREPLVGMYTIPDEIRSLTWDIDRLQAEIDELYELLKRKGKKR